MNIDLNKAETDVSYLTEVVNYIVENFNSIGDKSDLFDIDEIVSSLAKQHRRNRDKMDSVMRGN